MSFIPIPVHQYLRYGVVACLAIVFAVSLTVSSSPSASAQADPGPRLIQDPNAIISADGCYKISADTGTIIAYGSQISWTNDTCPTSIVIPNVIDSIPIQHIGEGAFFRQSLTSVVLPSSLLSIGGEAFGVNSLTSITLPEGLVSVGANAFEGNSLSAITIPTTPESLNAPSPGYGTLPGTSILGVQIAPGSSSLVDVLDGISSRIDGKFITTPDAPTFLAFQDAIIYTQILLADPSNPRGLTNYAATGITLASEFVILATTMRAVMSSCPYNLL